VDNISEVQATEYKTNTADRHVSVVEVTGVLGVTVLFQKLVIAALYELQDEKGKYRCLFNLKYLKTYLENKNEEEDWTYLKVRIPPKQKKELEDSRKVNYTENPATLGNVNIYIYFNPILFAICTSTFSKWLIYEFSKTNIVSYFELCHQY
jgi:hypothetical protein